MPVFREHMRSSNSTDFERTATLQDLDEMAFDQGVDRLIFADSTQADTHPGDDQLRA